MSYIGNSPISIAFLVDTFSGTGSQTAFTMTVAPANTSSIIVAVTGVLQDPSTYSVSGTGAIGAIGATALTAFDLANAYRKGELDNLFSSEEGDTSGGVFLPDKLDTTGIMGLKNET